MPIDPTQCQYRPTCPRCRCILDDGHPGDHDVHCGQPVENEDGLPAPAETAADHLLNAILATGESR